jgi:uncharacterized protein
MTALNDSKPAGASFADPGALGLGAFALTTFVLSMANANFIPGGAGTVLGLALFYGGATQLVAGIWEFAKGNTFGATAFCSYGAFWMAAWYLLTVPNKADTAAGVGLFFLAWTIFTAYMTIAAIKTNGVILLVFIVLTLTFLFLTLGAFAGSDTLSHIGGYLGILTALVAWYGSFATVVNATWKRVVLPVMPAK